MKRDVRGGVKKKPACHRRPTVDFGAVITCPPGGSDGPRGPHGGAGRSSSKKRQDRRPSAPQSVPIVRTKTSSAPAPAIGIDPPLITFPHQMRANRKIRVGSDCSGWASEVHALRLLGLGSAIDHQFACDIIESSKKIIFNNCRPKICTMTSSPATISTRRPRLSTSTSLGFRASPTRPPARTRA